MTDKTNDNNGTTEAPKPKRKVAKVPYIIEVRRTLLMEVGTSEDGEPHHESVTAWCQLQGSDMNPEPCKADGIGLQQLVKAHKDTGAARSLAKYLKPGGVYRIIAVKQQLRLKVETVTRTMFEDV